MTNELNELTTKLQQAETENASLKLANEQLENRVLTLSEKLEDANNEIGRMGMVLKHRTKDMESERQFGKPNEWSFLAARHH
jgi:regulator of replication initiation timing